MLVYCAGRHDEAIVSYRQALGARPDFPEAFANYVHSLQCVCEWRDRPQLFARWASPLAAPAQTSADSALLAWMHSTAHYSG